MTALEQLRAWAIKECQSWHECDPDAKYVHSTLESLIQKIDTLTPAPLPDAVTGCFYSYDPNDGIEFHDSLEEAKERAEKALDFAEFRAADSDWHWLDNEDEISYGEVMGKVELNDREPTAEEKETYPEATFIRDPSLSTLPSAPLPALRADVDGLIYRRLEDMEQITNDCIWWDDDSKPYPVFDMGEWLFKGAYDPYDDHHNVLIMKPVAPPAPQMEGGNS